MKDTTESQNNTQWWIHPKLSGRKALGAYEPPACEYSEAHFLRYVYFLLNFKLSAQQYIVPVTVQSYDLKLSTEAHALEKKPVVSIGTGKNEKTYHFGRNTYLILTGQLAGTILQKNILESHKNALRLQTIALRPLIEKPIISEKIALLLRGGIGESLVQPHDKELLKSTQDFMAKKNGYFSALSHLLKQLKLGVDTKQMQKNSQQLQDLFTPINNQDLSRLVINS